MFMRRFCSWLCIFAVCCSVLCGAVSAVGIDDIYGGNPWEDFENLPGVDQVFPSEKPISPGPAYVPDYDLVGEGGGSFFSIIDDSHQYITSASSPFIIKPTVNTSYISISWNDYALPAQIGSGDENMFGTTNAGYIQSNGTASGNTLIEFQPVSLSCTIDIPEGAEKVSFKGNMSFFYLFKEGTSAPVSLPGIPSKSLYTTCSIMILGSSYSGTYDSTSQVFNFDTGDIDISSVDGSSLDVIIRFSQPITQTYSFSMYSTTRYYLGYRFMFTDGVQATFTVPETPGGGFDEESKGLLRTIVDGVKAIVTGIIEMPVKIASAILDGIKSLFIPDEAGLQELKGKYQTLLETKFGFVYQSFQMLQSLWNTVIDGWASHSDYTFQFPGISFAMDGESYTLVPAQVVDMDNELMDVLRGAAGTIISIVCVLALIPTMEDLFLAFISGKSYFDFLQRRKEGNT